MCSENVPDARSNFLTTSCQPLGQSVWPRLREPVQWVRPAGLRVQPGLDQTGRLAALGPQGLLVGGGLSRRERFAASGLLSAAA